MALNAEGETVTEPFEVLKAWRDFSAGMASLDLVDTREEGRYDDECEEEVAADLRWRRGVREHQPDLDKAIYPLEVFRAIRRLNTGSAPARTGWSLTSTSQRLMRSATTSCGATTPWWKP